MIHDETEAYFLPETIQRADEERAARHNLARIKSTFDAFLNRTSDEDLGRLLDESEVECGIVRSSAKEIALDILSTLTAVATAVALVAGTLWLIQHV